jgi:uncharacterized protein
MVYEIISKWFFRLVHIPRRLKKIKEEPMMIPYVVAAFGTAAALVASAALAGLLTQGPDNTDATIPERNVRVMLDLFKAIEERDPNHRNIGQELSFYQPDVEFHWPTALPYGGTFRGLSGRTGRDWNATWTPLQPTVSERSMNPEVLGATDRQVVILYHQRGVSPKGERYDGEVIGLYELREFKLGRAQMFYFDEAGCAGFLERAEAELKDKR